MIQKKYLYCVVLLWLLLASSSILFVMNYDFISNTQSKIELKISPYQLYVFLHPYCPCSNATLHELDSLLNKLQKTSRTILKTQIIFFKPGNDIKKWEKSILWKNSHTLNNVEIRVDWDGKLSQRYQAKTSGETMLFNKDGQRLFDGGITISRGHEGDNPGKEYIYRLVTHQKTNQTDSPVFGCPLFGKIKK